MGDVVIVPSPAGEYVELAATGSDPVSGRKFPRFRKHILNLGKLKYQGQEFDLDDGWYARLKDNFNSGVSMCQVPLANDKNQHSENPLLNTGEVVDIERDGDKVYTVIEVRKPKVAEGIRDRTILGASAFLSMNYTDTRTQRKVGPALLHHCITNRPYLLDLEPYEEIAASMADMEGEPSVVLAAPEGHMPTKEELLAALKDQHGIDVEALQAQASQRVDTAALSAAVTEALKGSTVALTAPEGQITTADITGAIVQLSQQNQTLAVAVTNLTRKDAARTVDDLIKSGRLLPKTRDVAIEMALTNPDGLDAITAPENAPYVRLSHQEGKPSPDGEDAHTRDIDGELARLTAEHPELFEQKK